MNSTPWQAYRAYWDGHTAVRGAEGAVTGLGNTYADVIGLTLRTVAPAVVNSVVDVGCGAGLTYPVVKALWPDAHYIGVDISPALIAHCRRTFPDGVWLLSDEPRIAGRYDLIICHSVMTHIYPDDARAWLRVIHGALNDNGRASISIHTDCTMSQEWRGDIGRIDYYPPYFEAMLAEYGLSIAVVHEDNQRVYGVERGDK